MTQIDQSLNLLKDLEVKLKYKNKQQPDSRIRTDYEEQRQRYEPWGQRLATAYQSAEGELKCENKRLKRHVNRLIRMNQYLKNQLVKDDHYDRKFNKSSCPKPQIEMLKVQIEYLKELNRQKQLKIKLISNKQSKKKKNNTLLAHRSERDVLKSAKNMSFCQYDTLRSSVSFRKRSQTGKTLRRSYQSSKTKCPLCYY